MTTYNFKRVSSSGQIFWCKMSLEKTLGAERYLKMQVTDYRPIIRTTGMTRSKKLEQLR